MIRFVVPSVQAHTVVSIKHRLPESDASRIDLVLLANLARAVELPVSTYVFGGLEMTTGDGRALARQVWDQLRLAGDVHLLNNPHRFLSRYDLLLRLFDCGINQHRAYRISELAGTDPKYPVFLRRDSAHSGNLTELLHTRAEVDRALSTLVRRHFDPDDLIAVEFRNTADSGGVFRKYSACKVGSSVFAAQLDYSDHWAVKRYPKHLPVSPDDPLTQRLVREEYVYVAENPHEHLLTNIFDVAEIEYGRVDYSWLDGRPLVWEINSAPFYGRPPTVKRTPMQTMLGQMRQPAKEMANKLLADRLRAIDMADEGRSVFVDIDAVLCARIRAAEEIGVRGLRRAHRVRAFGKLVPRWRFLEPLRGTVAGVLTRKGRAKP